jgi:eukaryotic-like serine/threonine-protein kinase
MIGQSFGNYRVTQLIGEGGMGVVYLAEHPAIGRRAAVKVLRPGLTDNPELAKRFFNEARAANAIRHPGIVEVFDSGTLPTGVSYIVMELLEGESLSARLRRVGRLPVADTRKLGAQIAGALAAAHAAGIVHRDLKPDNLFLVPDERDLSIEMVKILDFGIAKLGMDASRTSSVRTRTGSVMGTPAYMSPEQCRGTKEVDWRTDIYALGVILYEMVCGRPPFVSEGFGEMVHLHISAEPPAPRSIEPGVPADLERIIMRCLIKEPNERLQTMAELQGLLSGRPPSRTTMPKRAPIVPAPIAPTPLPPQAPTTFTQAAHAADLGTDVVRGRRKGPVIALGALAIGVGLWATRGQWMPATPDKPAEPVVVAQPAAPAAPQPRPEPPAQVTAALTTSPTGARVVRDSDGALIGMTPFRGTWPAGTGVLKLRIELDGYQPRPVVVPLDRGVELQFALAKLASPPQPEPRKQKDAKRKPAAHTPAAPAMMPAPAAPAPQPSKPTPKEPVPL